MFNRHSESKANSHGEDAVSLLKKDHREVEALFAHYTAASDGREKRRVALEICAALDMHAKIEEKIFYPPARSEGGETELLINEGYVEHEGIKRLVRQIPKLSIHDDFFSARMKVLKEYVQHHVKEEETQTFPKLQAAGMDMNALGQALLKEKERLMTRSAPHSTRQPSQSAREPVHA